MRIWEGDGWQEESMSWKESCYVHAGLNGPSEVTLSGPDALRLLSKVSINDCYNWPIGTSKHLVMCNESGLIVNHGLAHRDSEDSFRTFACFPWPVYMNGKLGYDVNVSFRDIFILQVAGPTSLHVLEKATGENLRDVQFLQARPTKISGIDHDIEVSRIGMAGTLAYELRGPGEAGPAVYDAVYQVGKENNIKRLGWRTYMVNHVEGGFPQMNATFLTALLADDEFMSTPMSGLIITDITGSVDPADMRARFRTPAEVSWTWMAKFDHDFIGREAVESEAKDPKRKIVTLKWNPDDVMDTYASLFEKGEAYKVIELPFGQPQPSAGHADRVTKNGRLVGISSGTTYSYYYRELISQCSIDIDQAEEGNEVIVHWGDYGKRIKEVRATVARYPYLDLPRNQTYDLSSVPQLSIG